MVARCAKPERYFRFVDVLFQSQEKWAHGEDAMEALKRIAKLGGLTDMEFDACVNNEALFEGLRQVLLEAQQKFDVNATPTFIRSEEHTSELQSLMRISYAVFCLKKKKI